jgi:ubiquinone/menaquinone biosynthesis C-methylase UbiE
MTNHFDKEAQNWDNNLSHIRRTEAIANEILKLVSTNKNLKALEFGAGTGLLSFALKDHFSEIVLMDSSIGMIRAIVEKLALNGINHLRPVFFNLEKDDYNDKTFDFIFSQMALHHVDDIEKLISKFNKLLNAGGAIAIADLFTEDGSFHDFDFTGHKGFDPDYLVEIMRKSGFNEIIYNTCHIIHKIDSNDQVREYPLFLLIGKK